MPGAMKNLHTQSTIFLPFLWASLTVFASVATTANLASGVALAEDSQLSTQTANARLTSHGVNFNR